MQGFIARFLRDRPRSGRLLSGMLFGGICVIGMMLPIAFSPGVIFDPRSVILSMAGLFGGPLVAVVAACIAGAYRLWLGGVGVPVGLAVIVACPALGLAYRHAHAKGWVEIDVARLLVLGLVVHLVVVLLFAQLPPEIAHRVMSTVALPFILTFTPASWR